MKCLRMLELFTGEGAIRVLILIHVSLQRASKTWSLFCFRGG